MHVSVPGWRNWQTRRTQNPVPSGECGFDSHLRHRRIATLRVPAVLDSLSDEDLKRLDVRPSELVDDALGGHLLNVAVDGRAVFAKLLRDAALSLAHLRDARTDAFGDRRGRSDAVTAASGPAGGQAQS